jgi:DNA-binding FadR family transcriptional regulator
MALEMPVWDDWKMPRTVELPSERAERLVREAVARMDPGSQLPPIKQWAVELGTTRTTLSRVLKKLEAEGLVVIRSGWGTFVAESEHQD